MCNHKNQTWQELTEPQWLYFFVFSKILRQEIIFTGVLYAMKLELPIDKQIARVSSALKGP